MTPQRWWARCLLGLVLIGALSGLASCTSVPLDSPKPVSTATAAPASAGLQQAAGLLENDRDRTHTSLIPLVEGNEALGARLRIIEQAEHAIDLQYFLMKPDLAAALMYQALLDAADRGVRVRFLLDDVFTTVEDEDLGLLDAHPNIEVRLYNPVMRPAPKSLSLLAEFQRTNRRMHNKTFSADGAVAIVGGRNIADEYFQINTDTQFADFEVVLIGPAVRGIEDAFDLFWNDGWAVPIATMSEPQSDQNLQQARARMEADLVPARSLYERAVNDPHFTRLRSGNSPIYTAHTSVVVDVPEKLKRPVRGGTRILAEDLLVRMKNASHDVLVMTPYFVPEDYGARLFQDLAERGVRVRIVTNSLGSTNHAYVHAGYRRHRQSLLQSGVELYEIRPDALQAMGVTSPGDDSGIVMHTKLAVVDRDEVFVGSLNFDPRSIKLNTEVGIFFDSHSFGGFVHEEVDREISNFTYRLSLTETGELMWHYDLPGAQSVTDREPGRTFWNDLVVGITELLGVELQL